MRLQSIDFIRAVAILVIITCHFFLYGGCGANNTFIGRHLAGVGNTLFFSVSALIFGLRYEKFGGLAFKARPFLTKRIIRLFSSLWPFLIVILTVYSALGVSFDPVKVVLNFIGLSWFGKLYGIPHLWFVTMILTCYGLYVIEARIHVIGKCGFVGGVF